MISMVLHNSKSPFAGKTYSGKRIIKFQKFNTTRPVTKVFLWESFQ
jgi:hypothetical protein